MMKEHGIKRCFRSLCSSARKAVWCMFMYLIVSFPQHLNAQQTDDGLPEETENPNELNLSYQKIDMDNYNGSAYRISGEQLRNLPISNLANAISGLVPGFYSRQKSGGIVNENPNYTIRGGRTGSGSEGVLVLVDGQERDFGNLSPYEIDEIIVLKDAAATVLYGMRGANGAILVNTRKGVIGKPQIEFTAQMINQKPIKQLKRMNALGYATHYNAAKLNDGETPQYSDAYLSHYRNGENSELYPDIDWLDELLKSSSWMQRYNLNMHGGSKKVRYFINGGFLTQSGFYNTDDEYKYNTNNSVDRFNLRSNVEFDLTSTTFLSLDLYGLHESQNRPGNNAAKVYTTLLSTPPNLFPKYYLDNGEYLEHNGNIVNSFNGKIVAGDGRDNPWALLNRAGYGVYRSTYGSMRAKITQELDMITKGLSASITLSMDSYSRSVNNRSKAYASYLRPHDSDTPNILDKNGNDAKMKNEIIEKESERKTTIEAQVAWNRTFGKHGIFVSALYNQYEASNEVNMPRRFQNINGWASYNYDQRYGIDFLMSYSGAYIFHKDDRFGFFPTVSAGWTISNESFFESLRPVVSHLKLKGSYGQLGNHRGIAPHAYMGALVNVDDRYFWGNAMGKVPGYREDIIAYPNVTWEKVQLMNIGLEARLFNDRLSLTAEYFQDKRKDIYMQNNRISALYGFDINVSENLGKMKSHGFDIGANWSDKAGDFTYYVGGTLSFAKNEVLADGQVDQPYPWLYNTGYSRGTKRGYIAEGFFNSYEEIASAPNQTFGQVQPGDVRYRDINGDGVINSNDQVPIAYGDTPEIYYSGMFGVSYKGFSLSAVLQGADRFSRNINQSKVAYPFYENGTIYEHQTDYWTPENMDAQYPRISLINTGSANNTVASTLWTKNAWYIRLNTIQLSYDFPDRFFEKSFIKGLQLFTTAYNVYTWSNLKVIDPLADEKAASMPLTRNINFGLSLKF